MFKQCADVTWSCYLAYLFVMVKLDRIRFTIQHIIYFVTINFEQVVSC